MPQKNHTNKKHIRRTMKDLDVSYSVAKRILKEGKATALLTSAPLIIDSILMPDMYHNNRSEIPLGQNEGGESIAWDYVEDPHFAVTTSPGVGSHAYIVSMIDAHNTQVGGSAWFHDDRDAWGLVNRLEDEVAIRVKNENNAPLFIIFDVVHVDGPAFDLLKRILEDNNNLNIHLVLFSHQRSISPRSEALDTICSAVLNIRVFVAAEDAKKQLKYEYSNTERAVDFFPYAR